MSVTIHCPNPQCGKSFSVGAEIVGKRGRCKACGTPFTVSTLGDSPASTHTGSTGASSSRIRTPNADAPELLGRFVIKQRLGAGAFGTVYRAYDPQLDREVALKVPQAGTLDTPQAVERFLREAKAAAQLRHPHIVPVYDAGRDGPYSYIASAFIAGHTLADAVADGPLHREVAARIVAALAEALAYSHSLGIIHRDVKPANVMIDAQGQPHLMDFGLARLEGSMEKLTHDGAVLGTPAYMSPEQAEGGEISPASDQYSLGVVLYELLCGETPFSGPPPIVIYNVLNKEPAPPSSFNPKVPPDLETVCLKAMAKQPQDRYEDCQKLADDLQRWLDDEPIRGRRHSALEKTLRWARRNPLVAGLISTVGILLAFVALVTLIQEHRTQIALKDAEQQRHRVVLASQGLIREQQETQKALRDTERLLCQTALDQGLAYCEQGQVDRGAFLLNQALQFAIKARNSDLEHVIRCNLSVWSRELIPLKNWQGFSDQGYEVYTLAFSPDGLTVLTGGESGSVQVRDAKTGAPVGMPLSLKGVVRAFGFGPEGALALVLNYRGSTAQLWKVTTGEPVGKPFRFAGYGRPASAISPSGTTVVTLTGQGGSPKGAPTPAIPRYFANIYDAIKGTVIGKTLEHHGFISAVTFSPDGTTVLTGSQDKTARLWNAATGEPIGKVLRHSAGIQAVAFSPDGRFAATGGSDHTARLWDAKTGEAIGYHFRDRICGPITAIAFSPDGSRLLTGSADGIARVWSIETGDPIGQPLRNSSQITNVAFNPDSETVLTSDHNSVRFWDMRSKTRPEPKLLLHPAPGAHTVFLSLDGTTAVTGGLDYNVRVWNVKTRELIGQPLPAFNPGLWGQEMAISPDGAFVLTHTRKILDVKTGLMSAPSQLDDGDVNVAAFSSDGNTIVIGGARIQRLLNVRTGETVGRPLNHIGGLYDIAISRDDTMVFTGGLDYTARLWNAKTGELIGSPFLNRTAVSAVAISPKGTTVLTGDILGTARLWDIKTHSQIGHALLHTNAVRGAAFTLDGMTAMTASYEGVFLWDSRTGIKIGPTIKYSINNSSMIVFDHGVSFSGDGSVVLVANENGAEVIRSPSPVEIKEPSDQIKSWLSNITGTELDPESGGLIVLKLATWESGRSGTPRILSHSFVG